MKHIVKIMALLIALSAIWISLLQTSILPQSYTWLLPLYFIVSLGCYGLLMVGVGLMCFPTCPQEAILLQKDVVEAKGFLKRERGGCWYRLIFYYRNLPIPDTESSSARSNLTK